MKIGIIYYNFFDARGEQFLIGGVQTYIYYLSQLFIEKGHEAYVIQPAAKAFSFVYQGIHVEGIDTSAIKRGGARVRYLVQQAEQLFDPARDMLIMADVNAICKSRFSKYIGIQHGIQWDLPNNFHTKRKLFNTPPFSGLFRIYLLAQLLRKMRKVENCVYVDYNFYNWYRTFCPHDISHRFWVIPNFVSDVSSRAEIDRKLETMHNGPVKILFARRFAERRGTRLFASAIEAVLDRYDDIEITFAGEGEDYQFLVAKFGHKPQVRFMKYLPHESRQVHYDHHIAFIPSIGSEGTSISLLEAMGNGCLPVATCVGGLTNILIDGMNGMLVKPELKPMIKALENAIAIIRRGDYTIIEKAYDTAINGFSLAKWNASWEEVLEAMEGKAAVPVARPQAALMAAK